MKHLFIIYSAGRITLIILLSLAAGWACFFAQSLTGTVGFVTAAVVIMIYQLMSQKKTLKRINYFFEAVRNNDSGLSFPKPKNDKFIEELGKNLEKINDHIRNYKMESRLQEQYLKALIEHIETGIFSFDESGFVIDANKSVKQILGLQQFTHLKQLEKIAPRLANTIKTIQPGDQKMVTFKSPKQKPISLLIRASTFISQGKVLTLFSIQDINEQLNEKELDSWFKLIRVLTHEIMNSIAPVTSLSENLKSYFLKEGQHISPQQINAKTISNTIRGLEAIEQQGRSLISFVESYRQLTRLPKPEMTLLKIKDLIENTVFLNKNLWPDKQISLQISSPDLTIMGDEKMLTQVLINLIKNAAEALEGTRDGKIHLAAGKNDQQKTEIRVSDNGPGIPPELMDNIFVPFFTTRDTGSGIGLSLSRQIMRLHGAKLNVKSIVGKETVFILEFPAQ